MWYCVYAPSRHAAIRRCLYVYGHRQQQRHLKCSSGRGHWNGLRSLTRGPLATRCRPLASRLLGCGLHSLTRGPLATRCRPLASRLLGCGLRSLTRGPLATRCRPLAIRLLGCGLQLAACGVVYHVRLRHFAVS